MTFWNYRVMRHIHFDGEPYYAIHEAYYEEDDGKPTSWTGPLAPFAACEIEELRNELMQMLEALDKPVLDYDKK